MRNAVAAACALSLVAGVGTARADDVRQTELEQLAAGAAGGAQALERLRRVDSVDGKPVDIEQAFRGADGAELRARLEVLAQGGRERSVDAAAARARAAGILAESRFHRSELPRPLRGVLHWIGERVRPLGRPFAWLADRIPGGSRTLWTALAAVVIATAVLVTLLLARRRVARHAGAPGAPRSRVATARQLERAADEAERNGDLEQALRLRFRAGLLRLEEQKVLRYRESLTTREVASRVRSREFEALARVFDEVVYGGRRASRDDVAAARAGWPRVVAEAAA